MDEDDFNPAWAISIAPPSAPSLFKNALNAPPSRPLHVVPQVNNEPPKPNYRAQPSAVPCTARDPIFPTTSPKTANAPFSPRVPVRQNSPHQNFTNANGNFTPVKTVLPTIDSSRSLNPNSFVVDKRTQYGPGSVRSKAPPIPQGSPVKSAPRRPSPMPMAFLDDDYVASDQEPKVRPTSRTPLSSAPNFSEFTTYTINQSIGVPYKQNNPPPAPSAPDGFPVVNTSPVSPRPEIDLDAIHSWHCPVGDISLREYQRNIVFSGLLNNTLVCLPTGLGKTRIAAVIMFNFYRWFPSGKIIFMAPTKPLVNQQIEACHAVGGFMQQDMISMTGTMQATKRADEWKKRRIVFCTPQTAENDISSGICPADAIVLLVIDEAHKATGNYAYVNVVRKVAAIHPNFRVIALSATPGSSNDAVQTVISNLLISKIEVRTDESDDVRAHMHEREIEKLEVPLGDAVQAVRDAFSRVLSVPIKFLQESGALFRRSVAGLTKGSVFAARNNWRSSLHHQQLRDEGKKIMIETNYALALTLYHGNGLLLEHGISSFKNWRDALVAKQSSASRLTQDMLRSVEWSALDAALSKACATSTVSHPKMAKLEELIVSHFRKADELARQARLRDPDADTSIFDTRAIIFTQYRDSVSEIVDSLKPFSPLVKAIAFVGQSKGLTQKQQLQIMKDFKSGACNTLVATSIGEEGLDVGEVDLIVCFDAQASPQRMIQRMGRTGRQRKGRIVLLLSPGEKFVQKRAETKNLSMNKAVADGAKFRCYQPRISFFPDDVVPECLEIEFPRYEAFVSPSSRKGKTKPPADVSDLGAPEFQYLHEYYAFSIDDVTSSTNITRAAVNTFPTSPTPVGQVPHSPFCFAFLDLIESVRASDFVASAVAQQMQDHLSRPDVHLSAPAPKRRKLSDMIKPIEDELVYVSEENIQAEEDKELFKPALAASSPASIPSMPNQAVDVNRNVDEEDEIMLFSEPSLSASHARDHQSQRSLEISSCHGVSPSDERLELQKPSLFKRGSQKSRSSSQSEPSAGNCPVQVPRAPNLPFQAAFEAPEWTIPEIDIVEERSLSPIFAVPNNPAARKTTETSPLHVTPHFSPIRKRAPLEDATSPSRAIDLFPTASPPRNHRRLRRGTGEGHMESSFNEEDALIASLNTSVQEVPCDPESAPESRRPNRRRDDFGASAFLDLEPELSGDDADHDEEEDEDDMDDSSWLTDSPDTSVNADVNMQAIYRQSLLSQMSPSKEPPPGSKGFAGTPKRHHRNHFKMRFLDSDAKERHDSAMKGALDPPILSKLSKSLRNSFQGVPPSASREIDSSDAFEDDDIVSSFTETPFRSRPSPSGTSSTWKPSPAPAVAQPPRDISAVAGPRPSLQSKFQPQSTIMPSKIFHPPRPALPVANHSMPGVPHRPAQPSLANLASLNRAKISSSSPVASDDPDFDFALAELDIDAIIRSRTKK